MYIVVRGDLAPGMQLSQSVHAMTQFNFEHPDITKAWFEKSNYVAVLSIASESDLKNLIKKADIEGIKHSIFYEPDLDNQATAAAFEPSQKTKKLCSKLKLALK